MAPKPPTASASQPKKAPKASRAAKSKGGIRSTHTALGIAKKPLRNDKRTPKRRAADMARLEKTLPTLNTVVPAAASGKIKGGRGKIGKVFVDDHDADKLHRFVEQAAGKHDVGVESKLERARKVEAIREARRREDEKRDEQRREKFDETKDKVRRKRKSGKPEPSAFGEEPLGKGGKPKKKVGFA
ncbi:hypothetical protein BZA05DRAFT_157020 [Tricharina praecox]|uniref:uncharacterized protein n=1 Tax=Tricharina praecox TaxID=43433 RepID=UPI00221FA090|nr:uncharacterized protein BZA05DRAFT_157020 [Tricharina praecox]KAI5844740.1 hypothetical protein BZA05DRAFT_157020 [Tricharina praecox]